MEKDKEINLQAYADGEKLNLLEFNDLINIKGLDYMTQIDGDIIICKYNIEEDKEDMNIVKIDTDFFYTLGTEERDGLLKEKINEIIDYINKEK